MIAAVSHHKGPYTLRAERTYKKHRKGNEQSFSLMPDIEREDVLDMAKMLLTDPRDTVESVSVWSAGQDRCCILWFRIENFPKEVEG